MSLDEAKDYIDQNTIKEHPLLIDRLCKLISSCPGYRVDFFGTLPWIEPETSPKSPSLLLGKLDLVDMREKSWSHLLEFRKDTDSAERLRQLTRFVYFNYTGKSVDFVREDIERRIAEYKEVTSFWCFPMKSASMEVLLSGQCAAALGGVFGVALFGTQLMPAAAPGATATVGKATLTVIDRKKKINSIMKRDPVSYIVSAQEKLDNGNR